MGSYWRDTASQQAQDQFDAIIDGALGLTQGLLVESGEFLPIAIIVESGAVEPTAVSDVLESIDPAALPNHGAIRDQTLEHLRSRASELDAYALAFDAGDSIRVWLEHREGIALTAIRPYKKKRFGGKIEFDHLASEPGEQRIWG